MKTAAHLRLCENSEIPPTAVGGCLKSSLQKDAECGLESHPRAWVDCSDPVRLENVES